jgi:hypothetical protein
MTTWLEQPRPTAFANDTNRTTFAQTVIVGNMTDKAIVRMAGTVFECRHLKVLQTSDVATSPRRAGRDNPRDDGRSWSRISRADIAPMIFQTDLHPP